MSSEMSIAAFLIGSLGAILAAFATFLFNRWAAQIGWNREDRRAQDGKIERVDHQARDSIARVERELTEKLSDQGRKLTRLEEQVRHLPTGDDIEEVRNAVASLEREMRGATAELGREVASATAKIDGQSEMVRTIRDHVLKVER